MLLVAACGAPQRDLEEKGYRLSGRDTFRFEVDRDLLREWGGAESPKFNQVLEEELERRRMCRNGYALRHEGMQEGVFRVSGRCRS